MAFVFLGGLVLIIFLYESNDRQAKRKIYRLEEENKSLKLQLKASPYEREADEE